MNACRYVRHHVLSQSAVSLPSIGTPLRLLAVDIESLLTLIAVSASLNMIYDNPVSFFKVKHALAYCYNPSAGLMACDHVIISGPASLIRVFKINILQITAAQAGCLHHQQHLSRTGLWHIALHLLNFCSSRKLHTDHFL